MGSKKRFFIKIAVSTNFCGHLSHEVENAHRVSVREAVSWRTHYGNC